MYVLWNHSTSLFILSYIIQYTILASKSVSISLFSGKPSADSNVVRVCHGVIIIIIII